MRHFAALLALVLVLLWAAPSGAAQSGQPCGVDVAPDDDFASAAFGLTRQELDADYGPGIATQTGWLYQFDGFDLMLAECDLILTIDHGSAFSDPEGARTLVRTLLPEDAVVAGSWQFGVLQSAPQEADEWLSAELAARYRLLGEPRTGSILALYTYDGNAYQPGSVIRVELRAATIPG